jgi:hypothetical protein
MPYIRADVKGVHGRKTLAKCPKCCEYHHVYENWTGNGLLRAYCPPCRVNMIKRSGGIDDNSAFNRRAVVNNMVHHGRS